MFGFRVNTSHRIAKKEEQKDTIMELKYADVSESKDVELRMRK